MINSLIDFSSSEQNWFWEAVDDSVMGGLSGGNIIVNPDGYAVFSGTISLQNNGGFSSVRTRVRPSSFEGAKGVRINICGDGKKYSLRFKTDDKFDGVSYKKEFITKAGEWEEMEFQFQDFIPVFRGVKLYNEALLLPGKIRQLSFMISDKQPGKFELKIKSVKVI
ncbi:MAG: CIA30 family protein [Ignavibacteriales bacterium]|nr:CIA30 family protein [Ignavibacteriales bacterium]MCF8306792.1 CIA30 family protein [Ignavibacteriales bacterium]MCF8316411.1 CIA30 family protein [Ignavibacteriales bacterium]MCF8437891.1 CIA30 family protein [Ignavibacteriales bacterium]